MIETILELDKELFLWLNGLHLDFLDPIFTAITHRLTWVPVYILLIAYILYQKGWKEGLILVALLLVSVGLADYVSSSIFKPYFARLRPCQNLEGVHLLVSCSGKYGFVSSHAANFFALVQGLLLFKVVRTKWVWLWAILVAYSRIYVGVHYPADILFGALLGVSLAYAINFVVLKASLLKLSS